MLVIASDEFRRLGVTGEVMSTGATVGAYAGVLASAGYPIHHVPFRKTPRFFFDVFRIAWGRFDAIHIHLERASFWLSLTARAARAPVVVKTVHSFFDFTGNLRLRRLIQRRLMRRMGIVQVAISRAVQENERSRFGVETLLIYNWFDTHEFRPFDAEFRMRARESLGIPQGRFAVAVVGNCSEIKNHRAILRALALLPENERPLVLHVGDEKLAPGERELASTLGIAGDVRFLGPLADVRVPLAAADAYAMPSRVEGLGLAALEAISTGLPAVLSNVGGLSDLRDHFRGLVYVDPTPESVAEGLRAIQRQPRAEQRSNAVFNQQAASTVFSIETGVNAYANVYRGSPPTHA
jgi:glycosyltransferase involved in cell wall biosynthesis